VSFCQAHTVDLVTATGGGATGYTSNANGRILSVAYIKDATTPFTDGVDFTITTETTLQNVWVESDVNASKTVAPRQPTHSTAGVAALFAGGGAAVNDFVWAAGERIKVVIAAGGDAKLGRFVVIVG
jgi:hypothetical protein